MKKILVTGGSGYIGSFMVRRLKDEGYEVVVLDNISQGHPESIKDFRLERIDLLTDKEKLDKLLASEKFDGVVHMASFIQMGESYQNPLKYYRNNVLGSLNLIESMVENKVAKIILSPTAGVYGNPTRLPIEEDDPKDPVNPYGETKLIMENILKDVDAAYGIKFMSIRYFNAAGGALDGAIGEDHPNESHLIPNLIKAALADKEIEIFGNDYDTPDGTNVRDYIHVLDLVETHAIALTKLFEGAKSDFYNAGIGKGYSNKEVIKVVEEVTGLTVKVKYGPRRKGDADSLYASIDKIKKALNWETKYGLREIVESAYRWHSSHPKGYAK